MTGEGNLKPRIWSRWASVAVKAAPDYPSALPRVPNARLARLNAAVSVYRALGGGYDQPGAREIPPPVLVQ